MDDKLTSIGVIAGLFALFGLGIGIFALVAISWLPAELVSAADDTFEGLIALVVVGVLLFMMGLFILFVNPLLTLLVGTILGEFDYVPSSVVKICMVGSFLGFFLMIILTVASIVVGVQMGAGTEGLDIGGAFEFNMAMIGILSVMSVLTAIFGGVAGMLGSALSMRTSVSG